MASSGSTDENFRARVEKIFGSLAFSRSSTSSASSPSPPLQPPALWSLSDNDVEKREWKRDKSASYVRDETPCSSSFDELLKQRRRSRNLRKQVEGDLVDIDEDEDEDDQMRERGEDDGDEWSIRSCIGLDRTLDDEEEEDEYDKVAFGRENAGERLYMKDVTNQGSSLDSQGGIPISSRRETPRDPRANNVAAKMRLKEDEAEVQKINTSHNHCSEGKESPKDVVQPKPILKRKDNSSEARPSKRVRFDLGFGDNGEEASEESEGVSMKTCSVGTSASESDSLLCQSSSQIPDYLQNPSRYTCYSFDSSCEVDEKSNAQAYMDFLKVVKGSKSTESDSVESTSAGAPKKVTFIPQKKTKDIKEERDSYEIKGNGEDKKENALNILAGEGQYGEVDATEDVDDADMDSPDRSAGFRKPGRQYRPKTRSEETDT